MWRKLISLVVDVASGDDAADVVGDEPIWHNGAVVGWVTSGGYVHYSKKSVALGYVPANLVKDDAVFQIEIIGELRDAHLQAQPLLDPEGKRMRS